MKDLLEKMSLEEFRQKILLPILKDNKASRIVTYGNLDYVSEDEISELRQMIIDQGFCSELVASDRDVLIFVLACASKACEFSRHK